MGVNKKPIFLIGYMGSGKSTIGPLLAEKMGCSFLDLDAEIVKKENRSIVRIFEEDGEAYFRKLETEMLTQLLQRAGGVIALGGGTPTKEENCRLLETCPFPVIYLKASAETVFDRIGTDESRPMLSDCKTKAEKLSKIKTMQQKRDPMYVRASKQILEVDELSPLQAVDRILSYWRERE